MQRAAAAPTPASFLTEETSTKRRKKEPNISSSLKPKTDALIDRNAVLEALAVEEEKSIAVLDKLATASGDTRWVLEYKEHAQPTSASVLQVTQIGFAGLDEGLSTTSPKADEPSEVSIMSGRRSFGRFNKSLEVGNLDISIL